MNDYTDFARTFTQADNHVFRFQVMNQVTAQVVNITGWQFIFTAKNAVADADPGVFQFNVVGNTQGAISIITAACRCPSISPE